jgi:hypothetical protein
MYSAVEGTNAYNEVEPHPSKDTTRRSMSTTHASTGDHDQPGLYEIRIKGHLGDKWADWFEELAITREDTGETLLRGPVVDQAALYGLLRKVRDLGLPLVSVIQVQPGQVDVQP